MAPVAWCAIAGDWDALATLLNDALATLLNQTVGQEILIQPTAGEFKNDGKSRERLGGVRAFIQRPGTCI